MMKMLPGMTVINPCDYNQTKAATIALADHHGPAYLRFGRPGWPVFMPEGEFEIGKAIVMNEGTDVTIIATGHLMWKAVEAAKELEAEGISVDLINIHTIKGESGTANQLLEKYGLDTKDVVAKAKAVLKRK